MTFSEPWIVWGVVAIPLVVALQWVAMRRGETRLGQLAGKRVPHPLLAQRRPGDRRLGAILTTLALLALVLGAAGPEWGRELTRRQGSGSDVLFVLDTSASMDARDVAPSRLAEAKREALALLDRLEGSRVGAVAFAGDAVRLAPLTQDLSVVRLTLEDLSSQSVSEPGTDLGRALHMAMKVLPKGRREEQVVILWTDGEDLEAGARAAIDDLVAAGIRVFAVGVGTPQGDVVPQLDEDGRVTDIKRDENGTAVKSKLDEDLLRTIARRTHGGYFAASRPGGELPRLLAALSGIERSSRASRLVERRVPRFPVFALAAVLLLGVAVARPRRVVGVAAQESQLARDRERAARRQAKVEAKAKVKPPAPAKPGGKPPGRGGVAARRPGGPARPTPARPPGARTPAKIAALIAVLGALGALARTAHAQSDWARGNTAFKKGEYVDAESLYAKRARKNAPPALQVNRATARALAGDRDGATKEFERLTDAAGHAGRDARYNLGTVLGEKHDVDQSLTRLREALIRDPSDQDARWNYEVMLAEKQRQQQQKQPKPGQQPPQQPPQQPQPQPNPSQSSSGPPPPSSSAGNTPKPAPGQTGQEGMTKEQAQQLLGALEEMQRSESQKQHKVRVLRDRHGKDW